ncbi:MAG: DUF3795 domain-containing protein [Spirochaetes bacterium]|nr:DUF3795 domain-containing protein [Spirochaetota bacterium]
MSNREITAYCGLYCGDCIPSKKHLYKLANELDDLLTELKFENYAELKSKRSRTFDKYNDFIEVLREIKKLKCEPFCYNGPVSELGCASDCAVRTCVLSKQINGCWECAENRDCSRLIYLKDFHPGLRHNLEMIREHGIDNWIEKRGKHYPWD